LFARSYGPGGILPPGAAAFPVVAGIGPGLPLADAVQVPGAEAAESIATNALAGDRITPVVQWIFQRSPFVMWGGVILGLVVLAVALRWFWPRRQMVLARITGGSAATKVALMGLAGLLVLGMAGVGYKGYEFVEKDSRFCNGCHIFVPSGHPWVRPDTGYYTLVPKLEGKHDTINCHTCHTLKPLKEGVKIAFWMSGIRGDDIPEHGKVPRQICEGCHVQGAAKETWQAIAATAGHRTHFESDSSALKGKVECLTCHARTAHRFQPADTTCVQQGCHLTDEARIRLGKMTDQTDLHCTVCHEFAAPVAALATRDSAAGVLRPKFKQCFSCHQMENQLPAFSSENDPHGGTCGSCHNPHKQRVARETRASCTTAGCHADWKKIPFHVGAQHRKQGQNCILCHDPHSARVDQSDCVGCHTTVRNRPGGAGMQPPLPFDTLKTLRQSALPEAEPPERPNKVKGDAPPGDGPRDREGSILPALPADTFSHPIHQKLACLTCHLSTSGAKLTFEAPRGCQICHHQRPERQECAQCHQTEERPEVLGVPVRVAAANKPVRQREVGFRHQVHAELRCGACHGEPVTLAVVDSARTCQGCHDQHHEAGRACATCHRTTEITAAHQLPARVHSACDACHSTGRIAPLTPTRTFCLACHGESVDHNTDRECSLCHLQAAPEDYRPRLLRAGNTR